MNEKARIRGGFYLTIEGPDGCGKSTQYNMLKDWLAQDYEIVTGIREPGATPLGEKIREILLHDRNVTYSREVQMMLYETARRDIFDQLIMPELRAGKLVLADRSFDSTTVYQGYAGGIDISTIDMFNRYAIHARYPDLSIFLDVKSAEDALARISGGTPDKLESEPLEFHRKVVDGYRTLAQLNPERCVLIPYIEGNPNAVHKLIQGEVNLAIHDREIIF